MIVYTHVEDYVNDLYDYLAINNPSDLDIDIIAQKLKIRVCYDKHNFRMGNEIILRRATPQKEWQSFGHEITHTLRHVGSQLSMYPLFIDLQENQANYFSYHFCVPTFMLKNLKGVDVYKIMNLFNVEEDFAFRRLEMYQSKIIMKGENKWQEDMQGTEVIINGN